MPGVRASIAAAVADATWIWIVLASPVLSTVAPEVSVTSATPLLFSSIPMPVTVTASYWTISLRVMSSLSALG